MRCIVCSDETRFKMNLGGIEASFCYRHLQETEPQPKMKLVAECIVR